MDELLYYLAGLLQHSAILAPLVALLAGIISSLLPCSLASIPLVISCVGIDSTKSLKTRALISGVFVVGSACTFVFLGLFAGFVGTVLGLSPLVWNIVFGILMLLLALQMAGFITLVPSNGILGNVKAKGIAGAFVAGLFAGLFSSSCSTPVLIALLAYSSQASSVAYAGLLLFLYALGYGALAFCVGCASGLGKRISASSSYGYFARFVTYILAAFFALIGVYLIYKGL